MKKMIFSNVFFMILVISGFFITASELYLSTQGKTICTTQGCSIVSLFARDERIVLAGGVVFFAVLLVLFGLEDFFPRFNSLIDGLIVCALALEGYLVGFQKFIIQTYCVFCLIVASIIFLLAVVRIFFYRDFFPVAGFMAFAVIFSGVWFINVSVKPIPNKQYVLIYSEKCPHCHEVINYCRQKEVSFEAVNFKEVTGFFKSINIESVPVLICNCPDKRIVIEGKERIIQYLSNPDWAFSQLKTEVSKTKYVQKRNNSSIKDDSKGNFVLFEYPKFIENQETCPIFKENTDCR